MTEERRSVIFFLFGFEAEVGDSGEEEEWAHWRVTKIGEFSTVDLLIKLLNDEAERALAILDEAAMRERGEFAAFAERTIIEYEASALCASFFDAWRQTCRC